MRAADLRLRLMLGAVVGLWFGALYAGADWLMRGGTGLPSMATPLDALIPFWPLWAAVYLTVTPFLLLPLAVLPDQAGLIALALTLMAEIALAALIFVLAPVANPPVPPGPYPAVFVLADAINLDRNNLPSLHVALTLATALALWPHLGRQRAVVVAVWAGLICLSTLVTRQHDLASAGAGLLLAMAGHRVFLPRFRRWAAARG